MFVQRFVVQELLKRLGRRASGGRYQKPGKAEAMRRLPSLLRLGWALIRDKRIPSWQRSGVVLLLGLIFSPLDAVGNIPVLGQVWDFSLAVVVLDAFLQLAPAHVVNEHIVRLGLQKHIPLR